MYANGHLGKKMDFKDAANFLSTHGWLSTLPDDIREDWLSGVRLVKVAKGEQVFNIQDDPRFLVGVAEGTVGGIFSYHPQETRLVTIYGPGNWFGDAAVITNQAHRGTALARSECTFLIVSAIHVEAVAARHPTLWRRMAVNVLFQFDSFATIIEAAVNRDPTCKVITMILSLCKLNPYMVDFEVTAEELGEMVGLRRSTVANCLRDLEKLGFIERNYGKITILSVPLLQAELSKRTTR